MIRDWRRILRYGLVSALTWLIDFVIFALLYGPVGYAVAMVVARIGGLAFGFPAHRWFSFRASGRTTPREIASFLCLWLVNLILATGLMIVLGSFNLPYPLVLKAVVEVVVFAANFLILGHVFKAD